VSVAEGAFCSELAALATSRSVRLPILSPTPATCARLKPDHQVMRVDQRAILSLQDRRGVADHGDRAHICACVAEIVDVEALRHLFGS